MNCFDYICEKLRIENKYKNIEKSQYKEAILKAIAYGEYKKINSPVNNCLVLFPEGKHIGVYKDGMLFHYNEDGENIEPYFLRKDLKFYAKAN